MTAQAGTTSGVAAGVAKPAGPHVGRQTSYPAEIAAFSSSSDSPFQVDPPTSSQAYVRASPGSTIPTGQHELTAGHGSPVVNTDEPTRGIFNRLAFLLHILEKEGSAIRWPAGIPPQPGDSSVVHTAG